MKAARCADKHGVVAEARHQTVFDDPVFTRTQLDVSLVPCSSSGWDWHWHGRQLGALWQMASGNYGFLQLQSWARNNPKNYALPFA